MRASAAVGFPLDLRREVVYFQDRPGRWFRGGTGENSLWTMIGILGMMMFFEGTAGQPVILYTEAGYGLAALLLLLIARIWLYYKFQMRAMENAAPRIRKAICAHLYGGRRYQPAFRQGFGTDLQMIFDLTKWRFRDFFPRFIDEE